MSKPTISIISATADNNVIGLKNKMPWHIPAELKYFKKVTSSYPVIMGRKTFESIGKPLPNRRNIVISRSATIEGVEVFNSIEKAIEACSNEEEVFIIGGSNIYSQTIDLADKLYITKIDTKVDGDAFFPDYSHLTLSEISHEVYNPQEGLGFIAYEYDIIK